jgi:hypothetical protein
MTRIFLNVFDHRVSETVNFERLATPALHPTLILKLSGVTGEMLENVRLSALSQCAPAISSAIRYSLKAFLRNFQTSVYLSDLRVIHIVAVQCRFEVSLIGRYWYNNAWSAHIGRVTCEAETVEGFLIDMKEDPEGVYVEVVFSMAADSTFEAAIACPFLGIYLEKAAEPFIIVPASQLVYLKQEKTAEDTSAWFVHAPIRWNHAEYTEARFEAEASAYYPTTKRSSDGTRCEQPLFAGFEA